MCSEPPNPLVVERRWATEIADTSAHRDSRSCDLAEPERLAILSDLSDPTTTTRAMNMIARLRCASSPSNKASPRELKSTNKLHERWLEIHHNASNARLCHIPTVRAVIGSHLPHLPIQCNPLPFLIVGFFESIPPVTLLKSDRILVP